MTEKRRYRGKVITPFVAADGTTRWTTRVKCHSGCCERYVTRGTLDGVKRHLDKQMKAGAK